jgi:hypothetical protein
VHKEAANTTKKSGNTIILCFVERWVIQENKAAQIGIMLCNLLCVEALLGEIGQKLQFL